MITEYKEKLVEAYKENLLLEMAITKNQFYLQLENIYEVVTEHLILSILFPNSENATHWNGEIYGNFSKFSKLKYNHKKFPTAKDFRDVFIDTWFENLDARLQIYVKEAFEDENLESIDYDLEKLNKAIKMYINFVIENVDAETGVVDKTKAYNKLKDVIDYYNNTEIKEEASYGRIYQHLQDDSTFAIIGSQDQTTRKDRSKELYDKVRKLVYSNNGQIGFNKADGTYQYIDEKTGKKGDITLEKSLIIYNIAKGDALDIAQDLNQQSIVWKDKDFAGILYSNGSVMTEFENEAGKNMSATGAEASGYGTRLKNDKYTKLGYKFEGHIIYDTGYDTGTPDIEDIILYSK